MDIQGSQAAYLLDGITVDMIPEKTMKTIQGFIRMEGIYRAAVREIATKLENLNSEFQYARDRNPIHQIQTRIKTPQSIMGKLARRSLPLTVDSARENLHDIAGIRVICSYIDDIYLISKLLTSQDDIELVRTRDYIAEPKPSGYRSLHLVVTVPVFLSDRTERVMAEIQIRTIAMDFWASLEHELGYKRPGGIPEDAVRELKELAEIIWDTDCRMQKLHRTKEEPGS